MKKRKIFKIPQKLQDLQSSPIFQLTKEIKNNPYGQAAQRLKDSLTVITRDDDYQEHPDTLSHEDIFRQWEKAADNYAETARSNSAVGKRIKFLIRLLRGEFYSTLRYENSNLPKDLKMAEEEDVPMLKKKYAHLHDLPQRKRTK